MSPTMRLKIVPGLLFVVLAACSGAAEQGTSEDDLQSARAIAVTASSVENLNGRVMSVRPALKTPSSPEQYLSPNSALGPLGPIGAFGPLGWLGPVGDNSWNTSAWMSGAGDWSSWSDKVNGPLGERGPLGPDGPLSETAYKKTLPAINDFSKQLQAGGVWTVLGPLGPLGALGPLGPIGAHGFAVDRDGNYTHDGDIMRTVDVPYDGATRRFGLVEKYTEEAAKKMRDNDTSFMVTGTLEQADEVDSYTFKSPETQYVTIVAVPENAISDFDLELTNGAHRRVTSNSDGSEELNIFFIPAPKGHYIDFIQARVSAGEELSVKVTAKKVMSVFRGYRLIVVGSTKNFATTDIAGPHQLKM